MNGQSGLSLIELLHSPVPDVNRIINTFITRFNAAYGIAGTDRWDITKEDWQRYEFLGDRVLNLIIAQSLFTKRDAVLNEGEMTTILSGVVSNRALDALTHQHQKQAFMRLIPKSIGEQNTYGERITGGAFEAFIGALYCEVGLDDVAYFVNAIMEDALNSYNPNQNAKGILQEYFQKKDRSAVPQYRETMKTGPDHKPVFTCQVFYRDDLLGEGTGESKPLAEQAAARRALETLGLICR
ncbi:MAG: putative dsRNA-binding protein [Methanoregula sp.]|nr:putative dsRNA-binding protein [Methanoregula sp.]